MELYEIQQHIVDVIESGFSVDASTGEVWDSTNLDELNVAFDEKAEAVAIYIKNIEAEAEAIRAEELKLASRRRVLEARAAKMRDRLAYNMERVGAVKLNTPRCSISVRRTTRVTISNADLIPDELVRIKREPDKKAIREILKNENVPGAGLETVTSVTLK